MGQETRTFANVVHRAMLYTHVRSLHATAASVAAVRMLLISVC